MIFEKLSGGLLVSAGMLEVRTWKLGIVRVKVRRG